MTEKKPMRDKIFLDTNVVIYFYSEDELQKQKIANDTLEQYSDQIIISNQVINELSNTLFRKFKLSADEVRETVLELNDYFPIINFDLQTQLRGIEIKEKYKLQFYDSMILATALENGCNILFSEDMQHNQVIEDRLTIINPFRI